jgi:predicted O-methyltransferase YrrM
MRWLRRRVTSRDLARGAIERGAAQKEKELALLLALLVDRHPRTVVEIGTFQGGTLWGWCQVAERDALIVSIDLPGGLFGGGYPEEELPRLRSYARARQALHLLRLDSHEAETLASVRDLLGDRQVDFLFIDGDHSYEGVRLDYEMYGPLVRRAGLIALHDVVPHPEVPECQVDRLWNSVKRDFEFVEFVDPEDVRGWGQWGGIGVLYAGIPSSATRG